MLVESKPRRGLFVKQMSVEEIIDIFHVRAVIEGRLAHLVAGGGARSEQLMRNHIDKSREALENA